MDQPKSWYKKKRFLIPIGLVGLFIAANITNSSPQPFVQPAQETINSLQENIQVPTDVVESIEEEPKAIEVAEEEPKSVAPKSSCDPNYSGCVPIASDVDCAEGEGNGPAYTGRTTVIGSDIYQLDRDGDGIACDK